MFPRRFLETHQFRADACWPTSPKSGQQISAKSVYFDCPRLTSRGMELPWKWYLELWRHQKMLKKPDAGGFQCPIRSKNWGWVAGAGLSEAKEAPGFRASALQPRPPESPVLTGHQETGKKYCTATRQNKFDKASGALCLALLSQSESSANIRK